MKLRLITLALLLTVSVSLHAEELQTVEPRLINALNKIKLERIDDALVDVEDLLDKTPQFHLAQLVYADLLMAKAGLPQQLGLSPARAGNPRVEELRNEAKVRWQRYQEKLRQDQLPDVLMQLSDKQRTAIVVDLSRSRLYLFENNDNNPSLTGWQ